MKQNIFSYDIFDTCLVRSCGSPQQVFDLLARKIITDKSNEQLFVDFSNERIRGEARARAKYINSGVEEVTLTQIYDECDFTPYTEVTNDIILQEEINIECMVLIPVKSIVDEISQKRAMGGKILFISDMYLQHDVIEKILRQKNLFYDGDCLFVSSECKKTKATGNLFLHVKECLNLDVKKWMHTGDSVNGDYLKPKALGIKVTTQVSKKTLPFKY